jgi:lysophospholipase L1-like esterase
VTRPASIRRIGWALIAAIPLLVLGGIEAAARLLDLGPARRAEIPAWLDAGILEKEKDWVTLLSENPGDLASYYRTYRWDRDLFYRLQPDLSLELTDVAAPPAIRPRTRWTFRTNARGYNTPEVALDKPEGALRIVALGDSSTFGWGVQPEETYPRRLEALLRARHPGRVVEVINLGVCGYSSFQGMILMRREALRYRPDIVTLSYGSNDYSRVPEPFDVAHARQQGWTGGVRALLHRSRAYQLYASWLSGAVSGKEGGGEGSAPPVLNVGPDRSLRNLSAMAQEARGAGIDPVYVENCTPGDMGGPMREAARAEGVPLVPTGDLLAAAVPGILSGETPAPELPRIRALYGDALLKEFPWLAVYLGDHCHPNAAGQRLLAEALAPVVESTAAFRKWKSGGQFEPDGRSVQGAE